jgi:hypothetical protein
MRRAREELLPLERTWVQVKGLPLISTDEPLRIQTKTGVQIYIARGGKVTLTPPPGAKP